MLMFILVPFTMKELEKDLFKQKGIVAQTVEDIVKDLVSDELVDFEKIGVRFYYYYFTMEIGNEYLLGISFKSTKECMIEYF